MLLFFFFFFLYFGVSLRNNIEFEVKEMTFRLFLLLSNVKTGQIWREQFYEG